MLTQIKNNFWHIFCFSLILIAITALCFWQLFVNQNYQKINFKLFLKPQTLKLALSNLKPKNKIINKNYLNNINYIAELNNPDLAGIDQLTSSYSPIKHTVVYPTCNPECIFQVYDLKSGQISKSTPAISNQSADSKLYELSNVFYDETLGVVGYQHQYQYFVLDYKSGSDEHIPLLLHAIELKLTDQIELEFAGYDPTWPAIIFKSQNLKTNQVNLVYFHPTQANLYLSHEEI